MNAFVCPECGHHSEYDPWTDQARCRQCGFSPPEGEEMLAYLREQEADTRQEEANAQEHETDPWEQEAVPQDQAAPPARTRLTRFLPSDGRSFLAGLSWGLLVFAAIMVLSSALSLPGDAARCLALLLPFLTTFAAWRWLAWRETGV